MKIVFVKEIIHSSKKNQDFYVIRYALVDKDKKEIAKSQPLLWLTKEQFDNLDF